MGIQNKQNRKELVICLGSACFSRGNKNSVQIIKDYIKEHQLEDKVYFHGNHCLDLCEKGPILKFEDKIYTQVTSERLIPVLDEIFHKYF
jgi:NADH:ubiquinone oxidoreductase subunit E